MEITTSAFKESESIPAKFTCDGENINPELNFLNISGNAKSLVLIMDDPDAVSGTFTHWIIYNIDPKTETISENSIPKGSKQGLNDAGKANYTGPCPPSGTHRYYFKLYALDTILTLGDKVDKTTIDNAINGRIIEEAQLIGLYIRK